MGIPFPTRVLVLPLPGPGASAISVVAVLAPPVAGWRPHGFCRPAVMCWDGSLSGSSTSRPTNGDSLQLKSLWISPYFSVQVFCARVAPLAVVPLWAPFSSPIPRWRFCLLPWRPCRSASRWSQGSSPVSSFFVPDIRVCLFSDLAWTLCFCGFLLPLWLVLFLLWDLGFLLYFFFTHGSFWFFALLVNCFLHWFFPNLTYLSGIWHYSTSTKGTVHPNLNEVT